MRPLRSIWHFAWALFSAASYGFPSRRLTVVGITGTKGKSTTLELLSGMFEEAGVRTALLSSVYVKVGADRKRNLTGNSMPGRGFIQRFLRSAVRAGCRFALVEVTSQGVLQHRHRFITFDAAGITNLAPEHIEAHGSFEAYRDAKLAFFRAVARSSRAPRLFVMEDDDAVSPFAAVAPGITTRFALEETLMPPGALGEVNAENAALAAAIARWFGVPEETIGSALRKFRGLPGRMEFVQKEPFGVVVDYAHTPDSLTKLYAALRKDYSGLVCVLGSAGGGRDKWKRSAMGTVAATHCRFAVLTDEDPYDEDPAAIIDDVERGFKERSFSAYEKVLDRRAAIRRALACARPGEAVVLTGKGSETGIHRAHGVIEPWSETEEVRRALS
ncbi:MAG: hypothetical protein HYT14_00225 [Candidatus Liptonbacteria bacterium]|nr:hypothetical protein [Candidatus Liptonbacteria bacterium]